MSAGSGVKPGRGLIVLLAALAMAGCAPLLPPRTSLPVEVRPSPNFNQRRPNFVIIHHTGSDTAARALATLTDPLRKVSAHYLIGRDGQIYYLVDELARAWHAGESYWGGDSDLNSASIGIELDNNGDEPFAADQIAALLALLADLKIRYGLPTANFLGHGDIAPGRKVDPSRWFPWQTLAEHGFGLWCVPDASAMQPDQDGATLLAAFGYDVSDYVAAVSAFKRHFTPDDDSPQLTEQDRALLQCLVTQEQEKSARSPGGYDLAR